jgi:hypothetical protein
MKPTYPTTISNNPIRTWETISNDRVRHIWKNRTTGEEITVSPSFYEEGGVPIDDNGDNLTYVRTEILN